MISLVILIVGVPFTCAIFILQHEGRNLYFDLQRQVFSGHLSVPDFIRNLPFIGKEISRTLNEINTDPNSTIQNIAAWVQSHLSYGRVLLNEISKNIVKLCFAILSLFFFYRDGHTILTQVSKALEMVIGTYSSLSRHNFRNNTCRCVWRGFNCNCSSSTGWIKLFCRWCT